MSKKKKKPTKAEREKAAFQHPPGARVGLPFTVFSPVTSGPGRIERDEIPLTSREILAANAPPQPEPEELPSLFASPGETPPDFNTQPTELDPQGSFDAALAKVRKFPTTPGV